jgi:hypothetical protein
VCAAELKNLALLEEALRTGRDEADRARVFNRAQLLRDGEASRQYRRYHNDSCAQFLRCLDRLPRVLEWDALGYFDELAAAYDAADAAPATPDDDPDGGGDGGVAPADAPAAEETGVRRNPGDCADDPGEGPDTTVQTTVEQVLASNDPNDDDPSVADPAEPADATPGPAHSRPSLGEGTRDPAEPTDAAPGPAPAPESPPPAPLPVPVPVRRERTSDDFPVVDLTAEELKQFAPERDSLEQLGKKLEAIYGTGGINRDPAAGPPPADVARPPEGGRDPPQG